MDSFDRIMLEAKLTTEERKELPSSLFGIPALRKYPLTDAAHVKSAISYFHKAPDEYKEILARRIAKAAKKFGVEIADDSDVAQYLP